MARPVADLYGRVRHLVPELAKFGVVGGIGTIVDLGGAAVLHGSYHQGALTAKALSICAAAVVTYLGSRYWTFRHRENQPLLREGGLFVGLNVIGLVIAEAVIACTTYVLGYKDPIAYNVASLAGTGLGTIFRFYAYRKWVFLAPAAPAPAAAPVPAGAPWEPMRWAPAAHRIRPDNSLIPNGAVASPLVAAAAPAWQGAPVFEHAPVSGHAPARQHAPAYARPQARKYAPVFEAASVRGHAQARQAARPEPVDSRSPGRHRKR